MTKTEVVAPRISCRITATGWAALALVFAAASAFASDDKPNAVERTANKAAKGTENTVRRAGKFVEKTAKRSAKFAEKTANRAGNFVERTASKTEKAVKRAIE